MKFQMIPWLELRGTLHEFSAAVKTGSINEIVI